MHRVAIQVSSHTGDGRQFARPGRYPQEGNAGNFISCFPKLNVAIFFWLVLGEGIAYGNLGALARHLIQTAYRMFPEGLNGVTLTLYVSVSATADLSRQFLGCSIQLRQPPS